MKSEEKKIYWKKIPLLDSLFKKILINYRFKMLNIFKKETSYDNSKSILDIGTTSSTLQGHNMLLDYAKENYNITCLSDQNLSDLKKKFKNIKSFIQGDAKKIPFEDNSFDIAHSSATIEHVGSKDNQLTFVKEAVRVSKNYVYITTPNRYFPVDFHTKLPLLHWLPKKIHRRILNFFKLDFYAKEENLNLLDEKEIKKLLSNISCSSFKIRKLYLLFFCSNLLIIIKK